MDNRRPSRHQDRSPGREGPPNKHVLLRPRSPSFDDAEHNGPARHRGHGGGQRRHQSDASTDEIIRFVRGYQLERESTWLRTQKRAPLPGIGQATCSVQEFTRHQEPPHAEEDDGDDDDNDDDDDEDEDEDEEDNDDRLLDREVSAIDGSGAPVVDPFRHQFQVVNNRFVSSFKKAPGTKRRERLVKANASYGPQASYHRHHVNDTLHPALSLTGGSNFSPKLHTPRKSWGRSLKQLPPIPREELAERPSAPSPTFTPPGEEEELDSSGEPIDFIDAP